MGIIGVASVIALIVIGCILYREHLSHSSNKILVDVEGDWEQYNLSLTRTTREVNGLMEYEYVLRFKNLPENNGVKVKDFYVFIEPYGENNISGYKIHESYFWSGDDYCFRIIYSTGKANRLNGLVYIGGSNCVITNTPNEITDKKVKDSVKEGGGGFRMKILPK